MSIQISGNGTQTAPELVLGWSHTNTAPSIFQDIIGGGVAVTAGRPRPRSGTLRLFYMVESSAVLALQMFLGGGTFAVADLAEPGSWKEMLFVLGEAGCQLTLDELTRKRWILEVDYQELQPA